MAFNIFFYCSDFQKMAFWSSALRCHRITYTTYSLPVSHLRSVELNGNSVQVFFFNRGSSLSQNNSFKEPLSTLDPAAQVPSSYYKKKTSKKRIVNCSFSLRRAGTLSFLRRLVNYSSIACGHICMWMQLHCVYSDGSEQKYSGSFSHTHTHTHALFPVIFAIAPFDLTDVRKEENAKGGHEQFHIRRGWQWFCFPVSSCVTGTLGW